MLVHQRKTEQIYRYVASSVKQFNPNTVSLQAFGTDDEHALSNAFNEEFPVADHHRRFIQLHKNIEMKLSSIDINGRYQNEFLDDIWS